MRRGTALNITQFQLWKHKEFIIKKAKHITNLNTFVHQIKFTCVIFYLFFHVVQLFSHATHCSGHNIYAFGIILDCLLQYPNGLALLNNYPNEVMTIDIYFWITRANFLNVNHQPVIFVKTSNNFILSFAKVLY